MRSLAIPANPEFDRSPDNEYGTPFSINDDIPIDPALGGTPIDPALLPQNMVSNGHQLYPEPAPSPEPQNNFVDFSQAPQGDPFAPQPEYHPIPHQDPSPPPPPKPPRRKRGPPRERECGFCNVGNSKSKGRLITCHDCGRSAHVSCLQLPEAAGEVIRTYEWVCIECKKCEVCHEKGDDARILFCDYCDRGWHMDCLDPPVEEAPVGKWHCPLCPELVVSDRGASVASTSRSTPRGRKGKAKAVPSYDSDEEEEEEEEEEEAVVRPKPRARGKKRENDGQYTTPSRPAKRIRIRPPNPPSVRLRIAAKPRTSRQEEDEPVHGLFDDILSLTERDTLKTTITPLDKQKFEQSRTVAESKLGPPPPPRVRRTSEGLDTPGPSFRPLRSHAQAPQAPPSPSASPAPSRHTHDGAPAAMRISSIRFGQYDIKTWYNAPFPEEYANIPDGRLWICEFCLKYMKSRFGATRHRMKCKVRNPPGDEIYRDQTVSIFEVDGRKNKIYCQNLCLLSKMFLDHKSLFYDVEPFLFYVITEVDDVGARFVGYFSKEKRSQKEYNLSCIMTLPVRQRQGWGNLLMDFSYLLSKKERRLGSPEKPLSALGALGYRSYWTLALMRYFATAPPHPRLEDICVATSMTMEDVHATLTQLGLITEQRARSPSPPRVKPSPGQSIKFPKGRKNGVARRHLQRTQTAERERAREASQRPFEPPTEYEIHWEHEKVVEYLRDWEAKGYLTLKPEKLQWSPYILAKTHKTEAAEASDTSELVTTEKLLLRERQLADAVVLNGNGRHSVNGGSTSAVDSPLVEELFGDDADEELPTVFPKSRREEASPAGSGRGEQVDRDRELATRLEANTPRTRPRTRSALATPRTANGTPASARTRTRSKGKEKQVSPPSEEEDNDEEEQEGRRLRSRSSRKSTTSSPTKKRRRVESSSPEADNGRSSSPLLTPSAAASEQLGQEEEEASCVQEQEEPALTNGLDPSRSGVCSANHGDDYDGRAKSRSAGPTIIKTVLVVDTDAEVKSEDPGTPLVGGRRSMRSDDTVVVEMNGKETGLGMLAVVAAAALERKEQGEDVDVDAEGFVRDRESEDVDADADGEEEEEEDAEGDAEGEEDVEMEQ